MALKCWTRKFTNKQGKTKTWVNCEEGLKARERLPPKSPDIRNRESLESRSVSRQEQYSPSRPRFMSVSPRPEDSDQEKRLKKFEYNSEASYDSDFSPRRFPKQKQELIEKKELELQQILDNKSKGLYYPKDFRRKKKLEEELKSIKEKAQRDREEEGIRNLKKELEENELELEELILNKSKYKINDFIKKKDKLEREIYLLNDVIYNL